MTERRKKPGRPATRAKAARAVTATRRTDARPAKKTAKKAVKKKVAKPARKAAPKLSAEQAAAKKALEKQVKGISREIDKAEREAKKALRSAEKRYRGVLGQLKSDRTKLQQRLKTLAAQGENAFDEIKIGVEGAYRELSEAVVKAYGHFK
ncbi:MAG: hypothetical protein P4L72_03505 [Parvibaculum sp.]|uniref:hypothetical protein n=1 Tax=Parvibaculum sp. TaxID=2024848 RepID=UPI00284BF5E0|nr:hypothetical protein [Parvibaculum sp.]MDR3498274.1 hypothetical protein [Parvibaculum sp.]